MQHFIEFFTIFGVVKVNRINTDEVTCNNFINSIKYLYRIMVRQNLILFFPFKHAKISLYIILNCSLSYFVNYYNM